MDSKTGLVIQFTGIFLITVLSLFLRRSLKSAVSGYWLVAWSSLSGALFCLSLAFSREELVKPLFAVYFLGEYVFGLMLVAGCRSLAGDHSPTRRQKLIFVPFMGLSLGLTFVATDFNPIFNLHAFILATFFAIAFFALRDSQIKTFGWRVMRVALLMLALDFYHYSVISTLMQIGFDIPLPSGYLTFSPIIDLVLEILLGFGMVIVLLEKVLIDARTTNEQLKEAHTRLERLAQTDPLTTAFNRHAFYGYLKKSGGEQVSGCVGFFDIDDLKPINDSYGHAAGDVVIRAVARAIRSLMRAEDLIFRWGGDEFFVIMVSMNADVARRRMSQLELLLADISVDGVPENLTVGVSYGFTDFTEVSELEQAAKSADEEMYRRKQERKLSATKARINFVPPPVRESQTTAV